MPAGYWDIHNHILPGIDDGSPNDAESLKMIAEEHRQGVRNIIFTPHFRSGMFTVPADIREETYERFVQKARGRFPDMDFYLGCELHVQKNLGKLLEDARCRMAGSEYVLLEYSGTADYNTLIKYLSEAGNLGWRPIIAHAERCELLCREPDKALRLRDYGALIQINADTLLEGFLSKRRKFARTMIEAGAVDFIASDAHGSSYRPVRIEECAKAVEKKYGSKTVKQLFKKNPEAAFAAGQQ